MASYISQIDASLNAADEKKLQSEGFEKIDVDVNKGTAGSPVYIWFKRGSTPITRVQFSFADEMAAELKKFGFTKVDKNLNTGAGGDVIYLWYFKGSGEFDTPIVEIDVTLDPESEAQKFESGWEKLGCDLNRRAKGNWIYACVQREKQTYICNLNITENFESDQELFKEGYIRIDEDCTKGTGDSYVFIWYRQTIIPQRAIKDLQISNDDKKNLDLQRKNYQSVKVNKKAGGNPLCLWYKNDGLKVYLSVFSILLNTAAVEAYKKAGIIVVEDFNLNEGTKGCVIYLYYGGAEGKKR
ncbi:uncharacterized protein LOC117474003 [Trematomus bernacchii]|uniref:uncharacterized protein LOC117474003 n=1 Tax=Trematomus bernacchii TaxID=40690 RepID=UPI00146F6AFA|nr:uncharacterized protein LOC117474003 [Trematomus bernacchii]